MRARTVGKEISSHITSCLLTKREVKMAGYRARFLLRSIERQKRKSQTSSIDYEQSLSFSDLVRGVHAIASGEAARREKRGRQTEEKKERLPTWPEQIKYYWSILVNKGFIIWPKRSLFLRDHRLKSRTSN